MKTSAIILAAGRGTRMGGEIPKQFVQLCGKPVLYYSIKAYEESLVDEIVIVTSDEYIDYVLESIVEHYAFKKVSAVVQGGAQRSDSVHCGFSKTNGDYVLVHDGARPLITPETINSCIEDVKIHGASVTAVKSKDTIRLADEQGICTQTPDRSSVWVAQTPQAFKRELLLEAYSLNEKQHIEVTDDAMLVEQLCGVKAHMLEGEYENIKLTTRSDMTVAAALLASLADGRKA